MKKLYVPWRTNYTKTVTGSVKKQSKSNCIFCKQVADTNDKHHFILGRYQHCFVILNLYPYNAGHLLILPYKHISSLHALTDKERTELINLTSIGVEILEKELKSEGTNIGINLGKVAGGSLPGHLHMHIVPRWQGDTNFLPALTEDVKTISFDLHQIYDNLKPHFKKLETKKTVEKALTDKVK